MDITIEELVRETQNLATTGSSDRRSLYLIESNYRQIIQRVSFQPSLESVRLHIDMIHALVSALSSAHQHDSAIQGKLLQHLNTLAMFHFWHKRYAGNILELSRNDQILSIWEQAVSNQEDTQFDDNCCPGILSLREYHHIGMLYTSSQSVIPHQRYILKLLLTVRSYFLAPNEVDMLKLQAKSAVGHELVCWYIIMSDIEPSILFHRELQFSIDKNSLWVNGPSMKPPPVDFEPLVRLLHTKPFFPFKHKALLQHVCVALTQMFHTSGNVIDEYKNVQSVFCLQAFLILIGDILVTALNNWRYKFKLNNPNLENELLDGPPVGWMNQYRLNGFYSNERVIQDTLMSIIICLQQQTRHLIKGFDEVYLQLQINSLLSTAVLCENMGDESGLLHAANMAVWAKVVQLYGDQAIVKLLNTATQRCFEDIRLVGAVGRLLAESVGNSQQLPRNEMNENVTSKTAMESALITPLAERFVRRFGPSMRLSVLTARLTRRLSSDSRLSKVFA
ncbi:BA75_01601T0 [Komagataella pastoris]|uniref:BA75_01601T0 n=1 Tax=Komagataella pastoris TaxID=4922 RepID=A0A1B2J7A2_PICPA|nr:BA75_01601T0 [Komagataella pastoris]